MLNFYTFNVIYDGAFILDPLTYDNGKTMRLIAPTISYEELVHYIQQETGSPFSCLYFVCGNSLDQSLWRLVDDNMTTMFFDLLSSNYEVSVFVDYHSIDLGLYVNIVDPECKADVEPTVVDKSSTHVPKKKLKKPISQSNILTASSSTRQSLRKRRTTSSRIMRQKPEKIVTVPDMNVDDAIVDPECKTDVETGVPGNSSTHIPKQKLKKLISHSNSPPALSSTRQTLTKMRRSSPRILRQRLAKIEPGPGLTADDAIVVE